MVFFIGYFFLVENRLSLETESYSFL